MIKVLTLEDSNFRLCDFQTTIDTAYESLLIGLLYANRWLSESYVDENASPRKSAS
jgi:hypothetical protein